MDKDKLFELAVLSVSPEIAALDRTNRGRAVTWQQMAQSLVRERYALLKVVAAEVAAEK